MRVYIAGPMRGHPQMNFPAFDKARDFGEQLGFEIVSPADLDRAEGIDPTDPAYDPSIWANAELDMLDVVKRDIDALFTCDAIAVLPGWEKSVGAQAEVAVAKFLKKPVLDARTFDPLDENKGDPGLHFDEGKLRYDLISPEMEEGDAEVLTYGANKYKERNWEAGMKYMRLYASVRRHLAAWLRGEDIDPESGLLHLKHARTDLGFLVTYVERGLVEFDDRPGVISGKASDSEGSRRAA